MSVHDVLVKARNLIDEGGWWQYGKGSKQGGLCAALAIERAAMGSGVGVQPVRSEFAEAAGLEDDPLAIYNWNDSREDVSEVCFAFDRAIAATAPTPDLSFLDDRIARDEQNLAFFSEVFQ